MSKPPAYQCYPKDFLSDLRCVAMSNATYGMYRKLLDHCWLENGLPDDARTLAKVVGEPATVFARKHWPVLREMFAAREDGRLVQKRMEAERTKQALFREQQRATANKRWHSDRTPLDGTSDAMPMHEAPHCERNALQSPVSDLQSPSPDSGPTPPFLTPFGEPPPSDVEGPNGARRPPRRRHRLPEEFSLTDDDEAYARDHGYGDAEIDRMFQDFCEHHWARGGTMLDWHLAWQTWVRKEPEFRPRPR